MATKALAADLREDLSSHNGNIWTGDTGNFEYIDREESVLVEALFTSQVSAPIPKGKKNLSDSDADAEGAMNTMNNIRGVIICLKVITRNLQNGPICCNRDHIWLVERAHLKAGVRSHANWHRL